MLLRCCAFVGAPRTRAGRDCGMHAAASCGATRTATSPTRRAPPPSASSSTGATARCSGSITSTPPAKWSARSGCRSFGSTRYVMGRASLIPSPPRPPRSAPPPPWGTFNPPPVFSLRPLAWASAARTWEARRMAALCLWSAHGAHGPVSPTDPRDSSQGPLIDRSQDRSDPRTTLPAAPARPSHQRSHLVVDVPPCRPAQTLPCSVRPG